jgi:hypothetical protein
MPFFSSAGAGAVESTRARVNAMQKRKIVFMESI